MGVLKQSLETFLATVARSFIATEEQFHTSACATTFVTSTLRYTVPYE